MELMRFSKLLVKFSNIRYVSPIGNSICIR